MSSSSPTISVVLPTYNRAALLRQAIASVLGQTYDDWELIIADDGSDAATRDELSALRDSRVRCVFLERSGNPARARNAGVEAARGAWIAFFDSDDLWFPRK